MNLRRKTRRSPRPTPTFRLEQSRQIVLERAFWRCEVAITCGGVELFGRLYSVHHRRPRGMGGSRQDDTSSPSNLLAVCGSGTTGCHGWIESNRAHAIDAGWLLLQTSTPAIEPVLYRDGTAVYLTPDGCLEAVATTTTTTEGLHHD